MGTVQVGDNLPIMQGMDSESVDLVYADPPFNSGRDHVEPPSDRYSDYVAEAHEATYLEAHIRGELRRQRRTRRAHKHLKEVLP